MIYLVASDRKATSLGKRGTACEGAGASPIPARRLACGTLGAILSASQLWGTGEQLLLPHGVLTCWSDSLSMGFWHDCLGEVVSQHL